MTNLPPDSEVPLITELAVGAPADPASEPAQEPVSRAFLILFALAMFGVWMSINLPATVTIALRVGVVSPENKTSVYSIVAGIGTLVALFANPFFGRLSDRTRSRFGRRRPWIVIGLMGTAVGAVIIGVSNSVGLLILGWCVMQAFVNATIAALLAIVGDRVPEPQQGLVGAMSGAAGAASTVVGIFFIKLFPTQILAQIALPVAAALVLAGVFVVAYRDDTPASGPRTPLDLKELAGSFYINPRTSPDLARFLGGLFFIAIGLGVAATYTVYYLQDQLKIADDQLTDVLFWSLLLTGVLALIFAPVAGWVSDKLGRRKPTMYAAAILAAIGIVVIVTAHSVPQFLIGMCLVSGIATGLVYGSYIALGVATITNPATMARDLGVVNIALTLPYSIVPFAAPLLLGVGGSGSNYFLLYLVGGGLALCGIPFLAAIRSTR